jgi:glucose-1-phosphate adenylyltransferase
VENVLAVILGGGRGTRLYPLTQRRSKPAVPLAGKYRLVDIPISNCINSGLSKIYCLSQFQSASLNRHVSRTYRFDFFSSGFVEILAAEQTETNMEWYQGTADAVRKQLHHFLSRRPDGILILSGDQLYSMDFREILAAHTASKADITVAATPVVRSQASSFGILRTDAFGSVVDFVEKPRESRVLDELALPAATLRARGIPEDRSYLASMGIYVFNPDVLVQVLEDKAKLDFGKEVIPSAIKGHRVHSFFYDGYWEDIGTIRTFFAANLELASRHPPLDLFSEATPIYTRPRFLAGTRLQASTLVDTIICDGSIIGEASIEGSVIGIRSIIGSGCRIRETIMMGADHYGPPEDAARGLIPIGVGDGSVVEHAIIDKNARIGEGVTIRDAEGRPDCDGDGFFVRDGIVIIPKDAVIAPGTII